MSQVLLVGSHGKVAQLAITRLVAAGHGVDGVIRKAEQSDDVEALGATPVVADVEQLATEEIGELVRGHDVVVWSAGAGGGSPERTYALDRDAAIRTIDATVASDATRFVIVSYFGAGPDHGVDPDSDFFAYADAKSTADAHLADTDLVWTILRPSTLTDEDAGGVTVSPDGGAERVSRATVADVIAAAVSAPMEAARVTLEFNDGDRPVSDVFAPPSV